MASNGKYGSHPYAPSAPSLPDSYGPQHSQYSHGYGQPQGWSSSFSSYGQSGFPAGTDPAVIRSFEMVDREWIHRRERAAASSVFWVPESHGFSQSWAQGICCALDLSWTMAS
ncbi:hypothetical protein PS1_030095 [Malus domestica]